MERMTTSVPLGEPRAMRCGISTCPIRARREKAHRLNELFNLLSQVVTGEGRVRACTPKVRIRKFPNKA
jgi:hypothetical protein